LHASIVQSVFIKITIATMRLSWILLFDASPSVGYSSPVTLQWRRPPLSLPTPRGGCSPCLLSRKLNNRIPQSVTLPNKQVQPRRLGCQK